MTRCPACERDAYDGSSSVMFDSSRAAWHRECASQVYAAATLNGPAVAILDALGVALDELRVRGLWPVPYPN